jgi:hypothetical protein
VSIIIDVFVAVLLISAIGYGMVLNRRIVALRRDQADLERLAVSFNEATARAEASVGNLKKAAQGSSQILNQGIDEAVKICGDLNYLIDRGKKLGDQLENSVRGAESLPSSSKNKLPSKTVLNPVEPANESAPQKTTPVLANKNQVQELPGKKFAGENAEILGNEIIKSEAERELIKALQAVR